MEKKRQSNSKTQHKVLIPKKWFVRLVKPNILSFLRTRYNVSVVNSEAVKKIEPPFVMVGNHVSFWDPFFLHMDIKPTIQYITSDNVFRTRVLGTVMRLLGSIPTSKFMSDIATIANVLRVIKRKGVIGVFPEGRRTWDGANLSHVRTVAKLIHRLKLPVVGAVIKGGYLSDPRWSKHIRKGRVEIEYKVIFEEGELASISSEECLIRLEERLAHDDTEWQREKMIPFVGRKPAEHIEKALFVCPHCHAFGTFHSKNDTASCTECGYSFRYNQYGFLDPVNGPLVFRSVPEWNNWQLGFLRGYLEGIEDPQEIVLKDGPAILLQGYRTRPLKKINTGHAELTLSGITFHTTIGKHFFFPLDEIMGENVQNKEKLEFYHKNSLYRLDFVSQRISSFMWYQAIFMLHQQIQAENSESNTRGQVDL